MDELVTPNLINTQIDSGIAAEQRTPFSAIQSSKLRSALGPLVLDNGWEMVEVKGRQ